MNLTICLIRLDAFADHAPCSG